MRSAWRARDSFWLFIGTLAAPAIAKVFGVEINDAVGLSIFVMLVWMFIAVGIFVLEGR